MKTYTVEIDHEACWGCLTCEVACKQENRAADGVKLISVSEEWPTPVDDVRPVQNNRLVRVVRKQRLLERFQARMEAPVIVALEEAPQQTQESAGRVVEVPPGVVPGFVNVESVAPTRIA